MTVSQTHVLGQLWYCFGNHVFIVLCIVFLQERIMHVSLRGAEPFFEDEERCSSSPTNYNLFRSDLPSNMRVMVTYDHQSCHALSSVLESKDPLHVHDVSLGAVCT